MSEFSVLDSKKSSFLSYSMLWSQSEDSDAQLGTLEETNTKHYILLGVVNGRHGRILGWKVPPNDWESLSLLFFPPQLVEIMDETSAVDCQSVIMMFVLW